MTYSVEGEIVIDLFPEGNDVHRVAISSSRPLQVAQMFIGKSPEQVLAIMPMVFIICGVAQSRAALSAFQHNLTIDKDPKQEIAREILVHIETAREHLMRLFLDWPNLLNMSCDKSSLLFINGLIEKFRRKLFGNEKIFSLTNPEIKSNNVHKLVQSFDHFLQEHLFSMPCQNWLHNRDIVDWMNKTDTLAATAIEIIQHMGPCAFANLTPRHLPELCDEELLKRFNADDAEQFIAQPNWLGNHFETTCLSRQFNKPLLKSLAEFPENALVLRWISRLVELAETPEKLSLLCTMLQNEDYSAYQFPDINSGISQIETARGRLIHRVEMDKGLVSQYQILAPTEWNFHPKGIVAESLALINSRDRNEISTLAHLFINAIDPCVGYELNIHE